MALFQTKVDSIATGSTANTYKTLLGLKFADTAGHRGRLRRLIVSGGGGAPQDLQCSIKLRRSDNTGDGTSTSVNTNTISKKDPASVASNVSAIGKNFTAEPTTIDTDILGGGSFNCRGVLELAFTEEEAPVWGKNETLLVQGAPGQATAATLEIFAVWEEF